MTVSKPGEEVSAIASNATETLKPRTGFVAPNLKQKGSHRVTTPLRQKETARHNENNDENQHKAMSREVETCIDDSKQKRRSE